MSAERYELSDGQVLYRWTDAGGAWARLDDGEDRRVDEALDPMLQLAIDGLVTLRQAPDGQFAASLTEEGHRQAAVLARRLLDGEE